MGRKVVGSLMIMLGLNAAGVQTGVKKAERQFDRFERKSRTTFRNAGGYASSFISKIGGLNIALSALSVGGLSAMVTKTIEADDRIAKLSHRLGASTEALSEYEYVARISGVTFRTLTLGWQRMTRRISEAANGMGEARGALKELRLDAEALNNVAPERQFEIVADALSRVKSESDRVRLAMKLFDSEGVALVQLMGEGAEGMQRMREEARRLGLTLSKEDAAAAEEASTAIDRLKASARGLWLTFARELGPEIANVANWLSRALPRAVEYAKGAFLGLKGVAQLVVGKISWLLGKYYGLFGLLPGSWGKQWAQMAKDFDDFAKFMEGRVADTATAIGKLNLFGEAGSAVSPEAAGGGKGVGAGGGGKGGFFLSCAAPGEKEFDAQAEARLAAVEKYLMSESELLFDAYAERQFAIEDAAMAGLITEEQKYAMLLALTQKYEAARTKATIKAAKDRTRYTQLLEAQNIKGVLRGLQVMTAGVANSNRKMFELNKAAAFSESIMNAYAAFNKALAQGGLFGYAAAAAIFATGMANAQAILSTSFGGGGTGSAAGGGASVPSLTTQTTDNSYAGSLGGETKDEPKRVVNIYLSALGDDKVKDLVIEAMQEADYYDEFVVRGG